MINKEMSDFNALKNNRRACYPYPYQPTCTSQRGGCGLLVSCKSLNLSSFLFNLYIFLRGKLKWILVDWLRPLQFPPICLLIKYHCTSALYYFSRTESFNSGKNKSMKWTVMVQGILYMLLCWVCHLIKVSDWVSHLHFVQEDFVKQVY